MKTSLLTFCVLIHESIHLHAAFFGRPSASSEFLTCGTGCTVWTGPLVRLVDLWLLPGWPDELGWGESPDKLRGGAGLGAPGAPLGQAPETWLGTGFFF